MILLIYSKSWMPTFAGMTNYDSVSSGGEGWGEGTRRSGKMTVFVKTVGTLKSLEEETKFVSMDVPLQASVSHVIELLELKDWEVGFILVNGARATTESILEEGDQLALIAPLVGG